MQDHALEHQLDTLIRQRCQDHHYWHHLEYTISVDHTNLKENWLGWRAHFSYGGIPILLHVWRDGTHQGRRHLASEVQLDAALTPQRLQAVLPLLTLTAQFAEKLEAECRALLGPENGPLSEEDHAAVDPS